MQNFVFLTKSFKKFFAVMALVSIFLGYQLSQTIYRVNDSYLQRTYKLLAMDEPIDAAAIALSQQIQEWKDMLLRVNDEELYNKHWKAFLAASDNVQNALQRTKTNMRNGGMVTDKVDQLIYEHKSLLSDYLLGQAMLNRQKIDSFHKVDLLVMGVDRKLQHDIAAVKADIENFTKQQLSEIMPPQNYHYLLIGLLGAILLFTMSLAGFIFASYSHGYRSKKTEHLTSS